MPPTRLTVSDELPGVELTETERLLKLCVFARSGAGKTRLALSFCQDERTSPTLILDPTGGTTGILADAKAAGASVRPCTHADSVMTFTDWLIAKEGGGYRALVVDDFTQVFEETKDKIAKELGRGSKENLEGKDYVKVYGRMEKLFGALRRVASPVANGGAGVHVLITCWEEKEENTEGVELYVPQFAGKFGFRVPAYFDIVGYLEAKVRTEKVAGKEERQTTFSNTLITMSGSYLVKDRFNVIGAQMRSPTATKLLDAFQGVRNPNEPIPLEQVAEKEAA